MGKKIILCADGTWNTATGGSHDDSGNTNVRHIYLLLGEHDNQLKYYDSGVGTNGTAWQHLTGGAVGEGLFQKIQDAYTYLAFTWDPGDEIFIFGFSRGAYTARSLAGMVAHYGVPTKNLDDSVVKLVFNAYRETDPEKKKAAEELLTARSYGMTEVDVRMVGVWDTVGALGIPGHVFEGANDKKYGFLSTCLHPRIQSAYHAIALDEKRAQFAPTLWLDSAGEVVPNNAQLTQVWFSGVHSDVGGSYEESALSEITLRWMIDNAKACGLAFDDAAVTERFRSKFNPLGTPPNESWTLIPWLLAKHRSAPADAVLSNTAVIRAEQLPGYKPLALQQPISAYTVATVIPLNEIDAKAPKAAG